MSWKDKLMLKMMSNPIIIKVFSMPIVVKILTKMTQAFIAITSVFKGKQKAEV